MKRRKPLTLEFFIEYWLNKYHNTTIKEVCEKHPEEIKNPIWFNMFAVTQQQHDEWYEWAISEICKYYKISKKTAKKNFSLLYLNSAPAVISKKIILECAKPYYMYDI